MQEKEKSLVYKNVAVAGSDEPATQLRNVSIDESVVEYVRKCLGKESVDKEVIEEAAIFEEEMDTWMNEERVEDEPFLFLSDEELEELEKEEEEVME